MFEWLSDTVNTVVEFLTGGSEDNQEPNLCDVGECLVALNALENARGDVERACLWLKLVMVPFRIALFIISRSLVEYVIAIVILILIFGFLGIVIAVLIFGIALLFIRAWIPVINATGNNLAIAFEAEINATQQVQAECPPECQGNLDSSQCDLGEGNILPETPFNNLLGLERLVGLTGRR